MPSAFRRRNPFVDPITEEEKEATGIFGWNPGDDFLNWLGGNFFDSHLDAVTKHAQKKITPGQPRSVNPEALQNAAAGMMRPWARFAEIAQQAGRSSNQSTDGLDDILRNLQTLSDPSRFQSDPAQLEAQARASASAQYDPVIASLRQQMGATKDRGRYNRDVLGQLYGELAEQSEQDVPIQENMYRDAKQGTRGQYDELEQNITDQYARSQQEQEAMMKRLNIEAAASDILPEQQRDRDFFLNTARQDEQTAMNALGQEERGAVNFTRQGSQIARAEGAQAQSDLLMDLEQALQGYQSQIASQEAAKNQSYLSALADLQGNSSNNASELAQQEFDNYLKMIELQRSLRGDRLQEEQGQFDNNLDIFKLLNNDGNDDRMQILRTLANIGDRRAIDELAGMLDGSTANQSGISQNQLQQLRMMGLLR